MEKSECALCARKRGVFYCAECTSGKLQQRRTMLAALQADVAVLRKKTASALNSKNTVVDAELRLDRCKQKVEALAEKVMKTREQLCTERIAVVERSSRLEARSRRVGEGQQLLQQETERAESLHTPMLECLDFQIQWADENAAKVRGDKLRELFALFALIPEELVKPQTRSNGDGGDDGDDGDLLVAIMEENDEERSSTEAPPPPKPRPKRDAPVFFRTITGLPLPISGRYENVPPEVAAAALGKVIHLLHCLTKYLKVTYPHPMEFNGSFSTIGNTREGAGCHTLYPDGSVGFDCGVAMLHENVAFLCVCQGVESSSIHPTDLLGNLLQVYRSPLLGTLCDQKRHKAALENGEASPSGVGTSAFLLETSQTLSGSIEILPHYS